MNIKTFPEYAEIRLTVGRAYVATFVSARIIAYLNTQLHHRRSWVGEDDPTCSPSFCIDVVRSYSKHTRAACGMIKIFNEILPLADHGRDRPFDDFVGLPSLYAIIVEYASCSHWQIHIE